MARAPTIARRSGSRCWTLPPDRGFDVGKLVWVNQRYD
ncbi:hypothetical protein LNQ03_14745 [Klebsiella pneumoniae subsp. pneumoniae]|nr:hypothetical protein [Klebsiella pneumoniae subsp. pneumoniae]